MALGWSHVTGCRGYAARREESLSVAARRYSRADAYGFQQPQSMLCGGESLSVQRKQTAPCLLRLGLVVHARVRRAPAVRGRVDLDHIFAPCSLARYRCAVFLEGCRQLRRDLFGGPILDLTP